jgi:hypothetical protein
MLTEAASGRTTRARVQKRRLRGGTARSSEEVIKGTELRCVKESNSLVNQQLEELAGDEMLVGQPTNCIMWECPATPQPAWP